jgi:ADP-ribose pyrophosphatase YjhB (NUDIX family)
MTDFWNNSTFVNPYDYKFCPKCGHHLSQKKIEGLFRLQCKSCDFIFYQNPIPAVAAILIKDNKILLVKRKYEPRAGAWCLPAGFLEFSESMEEGLVREVKEETNLDIRVIELFQVCNARDDPRSQIVLIVYKGKILDGELNPGDDAMDAKFFPLNHLPKDIAFSCHWEAIETIREHMNLDV